MSRNTHSEDNFCVVCKKNIENLAIKKHPDGVCVNAKIANAVLSAKKYAAHVGENAMVRGRPSFKVKNQVYAKTSRRIRRNITASAEIIQSWKSDGFPACCDNYLQTFHRETTSFLASHHNLHPREFHGIMNAYVAPEPSHSETTSLQTNVEVTNVVSTQLHRAEEGTRSVGHESDTAPNIELYENSNLESEAQSEYECDQSFTFEVREEGEVENDTGNGDQGK